jgi:hypothetical protein
VAPRPQRAILTAKLPQTGRSGLNEEQSELLA